MEQQQSVNHKIPAIGNVILSAFKSYQWSQWESPKRFLYKGFGLTVFKWCGVFFPCWNIYLGKIGHLQYDLFHNGVGFSLHFPPVIIINLCTYGKIGWWYKKGIFRIRINKWEWTY